MRYPIAALALIVLPLALTGCETLFGSKDTKEKAVAPAGGGQRVAVMQNVQQLTVDPGTAELALKIPAQVPNRDWAQAGGTSWHTVPHPELPDNPQVVWQADIGAGSSRDYRLLARPVVKNDRVYTIDAKGRVSAFASKNGDRIWRIDTTPEDRDDDAIGGGIAASGDRLYVTTGFGEVLALDAAKGKIIWRKNVGKPYRAAPTVNSDRIYAVSIDNELNVLSATNGEILWHHNGITESASLMGASSPAVSGDVAIVTYSSGEIFSLRAQNGRVAWTDVLAVPAQVGALPAIADIRGLPVIDRGRAYAISHSGRMVSIDLRSGERIWENDIGGTNMPVVSGDVVYVLSNDNELVALTRDGGRVVWIQPLQRLEDPDDRESDPIFWSGPLLAGNKLWLTNSEGQLMAFSPADGKPVVDLELGGAFFIAPIVAGGTLYMVSDDGDLIAMR